MSKLPSIPPPSIGLGAFGSLINPVQVDGGKIFYFWDLNGDGFANANAVAGILVNGDAGKGAGPDTGAVPGCGTTGCIGLRFLLQGGARFGPGGATKGFVAGGPWL